MSEKTPLNRTVQVPCPCGTRVFVTVGAGMANPQTADCTKCGRSMLVKFEYEVSFKIQVAPIEYKDVEGDHPGPFPKLKRKQ